MLLLGFVDAPAVVYPHSVPIEEDFTGVDGSAGHGVRRKYSVRDLPAQFLGVTILHIGGQFGSFRSALGQLVRLVEHQLGPAHGGFDLLPHIGFGHGGADVKGGIALFAVVIHIYGHIGGNGVRGPDGLQLPMHEKQLIR